MAEIVSPEGKNWVLYDGDCGFCRWFIGHCQKTLEKYGFYTAPLQEQWVGERFGLSEEVLLRDLRLLLDNGQTHQGADAYRYVMRRIWWAWPLYLITIVPGLRYFVNRAYRVFADNRHRISSTCKLPSGPRP